MRSRLACRLRELCAKHRRVCSALRTFERLEAESIDIMREIVIETAQLAICLKGKFGSGMMHATKKAFFHPPPPFPLLHVEST